MGIALVISTVIAVVVGIGLFVAISLSDRHRTDDTGGGYGGGGFGSDGGGFSGGDCGGGSGSC